MRCFFSFLFFLPSLLPPFWFGFDLGGGWEVQGVFALKTHLGTETQYCKEEGPPAHTNTPSAARKGRLRVGVRKAWQACLVAGRDSPV